MKVTRVIQSISLAIMVTGASAASAAIESRIRVVKDESYEISVTVQEGDVRCSELGYGNKELKISVPDLKWISRFDHTNVGEVQPCMTAGRCRPGNLVEDLIQGKPGVETTTLHQKVTEEITISDTGCSRAVVEHVEMNVRGKTFRHSRAQELAELPVELCRQF